MRFYKYADVAELADALDSGSSESNFMWVQVPSSAPEKDSGLYKGDLKYGAPRSNPDGGISLHARRITFVHPVKKEPLTIEAPVPDTWKGVNI